MATENSNVSDHIWETSKENVKPIKTGRKLKGLQLRSGPDDQMLLQQQADKFEEEIKENEGGEDPLAIWIRYLSWVRQTYPSDTAKTMLLLERCTEMFKKSDPYRNDPRYIKLWIEYADLVPAAGEIFAFLQSNKIGEKVALFWIAWAFVAEKHENFTLTDKIFQKGIIKRAEPKDVLQHRYQQFQRRMARYYLNQSNTAAEQGQTAANAPATERDVSRKALGKLTKTQASGTSSSRISSSDSQSGGISRGSMQVGSRVEGISQPTNSVGFDIFSDSRPEGGLYDQGAVTASSMLTENKNWTQLAPQKAIRKENDAPVEKFAHTGPIGLAANIRRGSAPTVRPEDIYIEPDFQEEKYDSEEDLRGPNIRKHLDGNVLAAHSSLSDHEKLLKDPLAKHKQGEGIIVPVAPGKASSSIREREKSSLLLKPHESSQSENEAKCGASRDMPSSMREGFSTFSEVPQDNKDSRISEKSTHLEKSKPNQHQSESFAIFEDDMKFQARASSKKKESATSKRLTSASSRHVTEQFEVFEDKKGTIKTDSRVEASTSKQADVKFDMFCDANENKPKEISTAKLIKKEKNMPKQNSRIFDEYAEEDAVAFDDTTINTRIAKMDIDAMFFDFEDSAAMPKLAKALDLNASSSVVFPSSNSIADCKKPLTSIPEDNYGLGSRKDIEFHVFDDFSVIKSDSLHRSHEVSAESPFSGYNASPVYPTAVSRSTKKRPMSSESDDPRYPSYYKAAKLDAPLAPSNSLYLSSDSSAGELDSMQYSIQPAQALKMGKSKSKSSLPFESNVFMHRKSHSSTRISDVAANTLCQSIPVKTRQHPARSKLTRGSLAAPSSLVELSDPVFMRTRKIYSPPPSVQNEAAANTSLLAKKRKFFSPGRKNCDLNNQVHVKGSAMSKKRVMSTASLDTLQALADSSIAQASNSLQTQLKRYKERRTVTTQMLLDRLADRSGTIIQSTKSSVVKSSDERIRKNDNLNFPVMIPESHRSLVLSQCLSDHSARQCRSEKVADYLGNIKEIRDVSKRAYSSGMIPELFADECQLLPRALGGAAGFEYESSYRFPSIKTANLSEHHWADICTYIGRGTFGYVLLARTSSFQKYHGSVVLKVDHKKQFVIWEVLVHTRMLNCLHRTDIDNDQSHYNDSVIRPLSLHLFQEASVLAMPYCEMGDLIFCANYLNQMYKGYTHEQISALIAVQMMKAVNYIHSKNIIHQDIKLNNWVLRYSNSCLCGINVALIDFGKSIDIAEYFAKGLKMPQEQIYRTDLIGMIQSQYGVLFGKPYKYDVIPGQKVLSHCESRHISYDVVCTLQSIDGIQNSTYFQQLPQLQISLPHSSLLRFMNRDMWSHFFVPIMSDCILESYTQTYVGFVIRKIETFINSSEIIKLQKVTKNFMNGLLKYRSSLIKSRRSDAKCLSALPWILKNSI